MFKDLFRPVLSDKTILKYNKKGILIENKLLPSQIQPNSIDLTLGNTWSKLEANIKEQINHESINLSDNIFEKSNIISLEYDYFDPKSESINYEVGLFTKKGDDEYYELAPGEFILMASNEILNIPNGILSFVQGRSSIARLGIQTEQAGLIDAGFRGTITFEVYNQNPFPVRLYKGMRIAQVYFFKAQYANVVYGSEKNSKYSGQIRATGSKINSDFNN